MLCLLLAGCVVGEKADGLLEQRLSDRTLLVYMGGDNDCLLYTSDAADD